MVGCPSGREPTCSAAGAAPEHVGRVDLLPDDLAGQVRGLQRYDFTSSQAHAALEELVEELSQQMLQSQLGQMAGSMRQIG